MLATQERLPVGRAWLAQLVGVRGVVRQSVHDLMTEAVIGRAVDSDICISSREISRAHARVWFDSAGGLHIEDMGSRNGVRVNGVRVERRRLARGDRIVLGPSVEFECRVLSVLKPELFTKHQEALVGNVSAAAAPDLSQTLAAMQTGLRTIRGLHRRFEENQSEAEDTLEDILRVVGRAADLTAQVLCMARAGQRSYELLNLVELVEQALPIVDQMAGSWITVERRATAAVLVLGSRADLMLALFALCSNAIEAMPSGGTLSIEIGLLAEDEFRRGCLTVGDTGGGPNTIRHDAFEPFVSTKTTGVGNGLGLSVVKDVASRHRGDVVVSSRARGRTLVSLCLPVVDPKEVRQAPTIETPALSAERRGRRVLLVDDDEVVRRMTARLLRQGGYVVIEAGSGGQALAVYQEESPDLVLLDSKLPDMTGAEVYALLDECYPAVRVVVLNANGSSRVDGLKEQPSRLRVLPKPFAFAQLLDCIVELLSA